MIEHVMLGASIGALGMIVFDSLWDSWYQYRKELRASARCKCKVGEQE